MRKFLFASTAVLAISSAAYAADLPVRGPAPAPAPVFTAISWQGFYLGVNLGYAWGDSTSANLPGVGAGNGFDGSTNSLKVKPNGLVGGAQVGYNWQFNSFVFGVEGEVGYLGLNKTQIVGDDLASVKYGLFGTVTARLGFTFDRALIYAKGGIAFADVQNRASDLVGVGGPIDLTDFSSRSGTRTGWTVGAGLEYAFTNSWRGRLEYQYMDFGDQRSTNLDGDFFRHSNSVQTVRAGLNYYFTPARPVMARY
jgi:outer membrane immunogenic protein